MTENKDIKRIIHFDERRKILSVKTEEKKEAINGEINGGNLTFISDAEYNEEGIKMILANANKTKEQAEKIIPNLKDRIAELEEDLKKIGDIEMTPEMEQLKANLEKLKTIIESVEPKKKEMENIKKMLENAEENRKTANKDIQEIKTEIGGRLKL